MRQESNDQLGPHLMVGGGVCDVTPREPTFLYGYPHAARISTGVNDPLLASAICVSDGANTVVLVSADTIWLSKQQVVTARARISAETGLAPADLMIAATHTHSGPVTVPMLSNSDDAVVPPPNPDYLSLLISGIVGAAVDAYRSAVPAEVAIVSTECAAIGGNRHDPNGPAIREIPVLAARAVADPTRWLGLMYVNRVHPTILHEDSTVISADFPGMCRSYLQAHLVGRDCPVLSHLGAAGNQSPRFVAQSHTVAEASRIGHLLGHAIETALADAKFTSAASVSCESIAIDLPPRSLPSIEDSKKLLQRAKSQLASSRESKAGYGAVRTAQCAVFGAEETLCLARSASTSGLHEALRRCLPAEIQLLRIGNLALVAWPGEVFVEFALQVCKQHPESKVITLANGELQGYVVTSETARGNCYEACNAVFAGPASGAALVNASLELLARTRDVSRDNACVELPD